MTGGRSPGRCLPLSVLVYALSRRCTSRIGDLERATDQKRNGRVQSGICWSAGSLDEANRAPAQIKAGPPQEPLLCVDHFQADNWPTGGLATGGQGSDVTHRLVRRLLRGCWHSRPLALGVAGLNGKGTSSLPRYFGTREACDLGDCASQ